MSYGEVDTAWFCIKTLPRQESAAQFAIQRLGFPVFCPQILVEVKQRIRAPWKSTTRLVPMFAGYCFASFDADEGPYRTWPHIIRQPGVVRILSMPAAGQILPRPHALDDELIEALRTISRAAMQTPEAVSLAIPAGSQVRITEGPLADLQGIVAWSNEQRCQLLMSWFQGERRVEVPRKFVEVV